MCIAFFIPQCRLTSRISRLAVNVTERSEQSGLFRLAFIRLLGRRARSEHVDRPTKRVAPPTQVCRPRLPHALNHLRQVRIIWMGASVLGCREPLEALISVPVILAAYDGVNELHS